MRKSLYIAAALAAAAVSCQKETVSEAGDSSEGIFTVTAEIARLDSDTRTSIDGTAATIEPVWSEGDEIKLFSTDGESAVYVVNAEDVGQPLASFSLKDGESALSGTFACAYYPAANATAYEEGTGITAVIPDGQTYAVPAKAGVNAGTFATGSFPMVGTGTMKAGSKNLNLAFKNVFGVLQLNFTGTETISRIDLTSSGSLSGTATVTTDAECSFASGNKYVTLTMTDPVTLSATAAAFYIALPVSSVSRIYVTTGNGLQLKCKEIPISRSRITSMKQATLSAAGFGAVVYGEAPEMTPVIINGTVWAPVNCGYDADHPLGKLYQWGRKAGGGYTVAEGRQETVTATYDDDGYNRTPDAGKLYTRKDTPYDWYTNDAAKQLTAWPMNSEDAGYVEGFVDNPSPEGWRVPTYEELISLTGGKNLGVTGYDYGAWDSANKGFWFNGTANPVKNAGLFLPAAGYYKAAGYAKWGYDAENRGEIGYYWSSTVETGTTYACQRYFSVNRAIMDKAYRGHALSVRCVLE